MPTIYKDFINHILWDVPTFSDEDITTLFNLYNNYVCPTTGESMQYNRCCGSCISKVKNSVKAFYPQGTIIE